MIMLFRTCCYCTAAIAAVAATTPMAATAQSSTLRGASSAEDSPAAYAKQHRNLAGATGRYLEQLTEFNDDAFVLSEDLEPQARRLRELKGKSNKPQAVSQGKKKNAAFELDNGEILEIEGMAAEDVDWFESGEMVELPLEATMDGKKVNVKGKPMGKSGKETSRRKLATLTGDKTVVGVRVVTSCGQSTTSSEVDLQQHIFDDAVNLATQYKACSHNKLNIIKPSDRSSSNTAIASDIVNGVMTVNINQCTTTESDDVNMRNQITEAINSAFGVSAPTDIADHFMYCLPSGSMGGIAYAFMNSWMSVYSDTWCNSVSAQLHEVGHNLNFGHANEGTTEYADQAGMMGYSYGESDSPVMCFNAAKSWQSGWFADKSLTIYPNDDAGTCFSGELYGLDSYTSSPADAKVLIQLQSTSGTHYHIGFNGKQGSNIGTVEHGNQVLITTQKSTGASTKVAHLGAGGSYTISDYDGSGRDVTVSVTSISGSDHAVIDIQCGPALCSSNDQCDDGNACTANVCDGACNFLPIANCCGNGICESGENFDSCFADCTKGPNEVTSDMCSTCYAYDGNMFEVKAKDEDLAITTLSTRGYTTGTFGVEVWTKQGTMIGFEHDQSAWTKIADVSFTSGGWEMLQFPEFAMPVHVAAGQTQSFYVMYKGGQGLFSYSNPGVNTLVSEDANLQLFHGYYNVNGFGGKGQGTWNGVMTYVTAKGVVAPLPTSPPSMPPTLPPTAAPLNPPTSLPTNPPSSNPTSAPSTLPTSAPSNPPTPNPTPVPVAPTPPPVPSPTNPPTSLPTALPTALPTPVPSNPPSAPPTAPPSVPPTPLPSAPPTLPPTPVPTMPSKTLVCGRGDMPTKPCVEGLKRTAPINDIHEVRCCRDCTADMNCDLPWKEQCSGFKSGLFARSKFGAVCKTGTFAEAVDFCRNTGDDNTRLCTPEEVENSCTKGTGCNFDQHLVWTCAYDGHECSSDDECCGSCVNDTCQGEPTKAPTQPPSPAPTESPTQKPTFQPSNNPTPAPSKSPTSLPTPAPSSPPTNQPSNHPTTSPPTSQPVLATHAPSPGPTPVPSNPPTSPPTALPTNVVTSAPTSNPTGQPTAQPTNLTSPPTSNPTGQPTAQPTTSQPTGVASKTLVCGRGDIPTKPCVEGLKRTAPINDIHEVRCCRDCTADMNCDLPWKEQCSGFKSGLFARSKFGGVCKTGTFAEAVDFCRNTGDDNTRLCTPEEVENSCTKGTGCNFDQHLVWTCAYDGHECSSDDECCGSCVNNTCQGENNLIPMETTLQAAEVEDRSKYVCSKHRPLDETICEDGDEADDTCSYEGQICGMRENTCWFAACGGDEEVSE